MHFWADVPAAKHDKVYALPQTTIHGPPTVKYRGLFINDEAPALTGWWARKANVSDYTLGADFYAEVFDLILRLKGNFMWPAMWASFVPEPGRIFFTDDPGNQQLADDYGIVMSTSHHEPMQRATNEWAVVGEGPWNWVENKQNIVSFMDEGIRRAGNNESYFTLGMRGENDGPVEGDDPMEILKDIFATERALIAKHYGNESAVPQVWTVYKEVQAYYEAGLVPAEDVTLIFSDDNWGNIRRLPTAHEANRGGGIGVSEVAVLSILGLELKQTIGILPSCLRWRSQGLQMAKHKQSSTRSFIYSSDCRSINILVLAQIIQRALPGTAARCGSNLDLQHRRYQAPGTAFFIRHGLSMEYLQY